MSTGGSLQKAGGKVPHIPPKPVVTQAQVGMILSCALYLALRTQCFPPSVVTTSRVHALCYSANRPLPALTPLPGSAGVEAAWFYMVRLCVSVWLCFLLSLVAWFGCLVYPKKITPCFFVLGQVRTGSFSNVQ